MHWLSDMSIDPALYQQHFCYNAFYLDEFGHITNSRHLLKYAGRRLVGLRRRGHKKHAFPAAGGRNVHNEKADCCSVGAPRQLAQETGGAFSI